MKIFLKKILFTVLISIALLVASSVFITTFPRISYDVGYCESWVDVAIRIYCSKHEIKSDTLYVGDSVAAQFFNYDDNNKTNYLTTNGRILSIGQYILIYNAIIRNPNITTVVYLSIPQTIGYDFQRSETCDNFIKPFLSFENKKHFDEEFYQVLDKNPLSYLYFFPFYKVLPISEINFEDTLVNNENPLSDFSIHWMDKIVNLCNDKRVKFILACPPVAESMKAKTNDWEDLRSQINHLDKKNKNLYTRYLSTVQYSEDKFLLDKTHWKKDFVADNRKELIKNMFDLYNNYSDTVSQK